jgi:hypothetical protein
VIVGSLVFLIVAAVLLLVLPRRYAVIPVLLAAAYTTRVPVLELGPANLSVLRILVLVGIVRVLVRQERIANGVNGVDLLLFVWAMLLIGESAFHTADAWTFRIGMVLGELGVYFLCRVFVQDSEDVRRLFRVLCVALVPLAALMLLEKYTAHNYFGLMGGGQLTVRDGHVRASGPFAHAILAGTVGATCLPMALSLWRTHRATALIGLCAAVGIVFASTSTGPVMVTVSVCAALLIWNVRKGLALVRWATLAAIIGLEFVMNDPVYFLMARIDVTGSSTGWHRAQLIRSALAHLDEWWVVGTDYTRHWMPTGIYANAVHTDITNHFLQMGILGGLPLLLAFLLVLCAAFRAVGTALHEAEGRSRQEAFLIWTMGTILFGHVVNFLSISLFDQSASFFYLVLATIGAVQVPVAQVAKASLPNAKRWTRERHAVQAPAGTPRRKKSASGGPRWTGWRWVVDRWPRSASSVELMGEIEDERRPIHDSGMCQQRRRAPEEPSLVAWPPEWRT